MIRSLDVWAERLDHHFRQLAGARQSSDFPIFALEHGLGPEELADIAGQLHARLASGQRLAPYWLLWVVYATEQGYAYDGHEYWVSFEESTPGWRERATPRQLRGYFEKFQATYRGVIPTGPWADWFRNIAWPITHAILPKYLQIQFARALYDASYQLARLPSLTPRSAGEVLAGAAWHASSRFQEFLEQQELAGRIVLALLDQGSVAGQSPIFPQTLTRIVADLERVRSAGEWLKEARRVVTDQFRGVARGREGALSRDRGTDQPERRDQSGLDIRPTLTLRRGEAGGWLPIIELPSFAPIAQLGSDLSGFLRTTRCRVAGVGEDYFPRGWLLGGNQRRVLRSWPPATAPVIEFERPHPLLDTMLQRDCRISSGPSWLFRVGPDGIAHEITGHAVRPGQSYVLVATKPLAPIPAFASPSEIKCDGMRASLLSIPETVSSELAADLHRLSLDVVRNVRLWPAGLPVWRWDGEGHGEWLTTESPCFGIVHDHPVDEYVVTLDERGEVSIEGGRAGAPVFVRLPPLPPGRHVLRVHARRVGVSLSAQALKDLEGRVELMVRDPLPWIPATTAHSGLSLVVDPPDPTLDRLWEGEVSLSVAGPASRSVECLLQLTKRDGTDLLHESIGIFELPLTPSHWQSRLRPFVSDETRMWKYFDAASGVLVINGGDLGRFTLSLERERRPLRWICWPDHHVTRARLLDDTGSDENAAISLRRFAEPNRPLAIPAGASSDDMIVEEPGGLFSAHRADQEDKLVISSSHRGLALSELLIEPQIQALSNDEELVAAFRTAESWAGARLAGPLARERRGRVVEALLTAIVAYLCGARWAESHRAFLANSASEAAISALVHAVGSKSFAVVVRRGAAQLECDREAGGKWFTDIAIRYGVSGDAVLCRFALEFALAPLQARAVFGDRFEPLLCKGRSATVLFRAAHLAALVARSTPAAAQPQPTASAAC